MSDRARLSGLLRGVMLAGAVALSAGAMPGHAQQTQSPRDVDIEADQMQVLEDQKQAIFTGKVDATRGNVRLNADKLVVYYREDEQADGSTKNKVNDLHATGNVVIITKSQRITGQWAKMNVPSNKLTVGGDVVVRQGSTVVRGPELYVDLDTNVSQMKGGRVKGSFVPGQ